MKRGAPLSKPVTTLINNALRKAKLTQRLVRGRGYYYVTDVAVSSSLYQFWLEPFQLDLDIARHHVNGVLAEEGVHYHINAALQCVPHGVGYTGYLRSATNVFAPKSVEEWQKEVARG